MAVSGTLPYLFQRGYQVWSGTNSSVTARQRGSSGDHKVMSNISNGCLGFKAKLLSVGSPEIAPD